MRKRWGYVSSAHTKRVLQMLVIYDLPRIHTHRVIQIREVEPSWQQTREKAPLQWMAKIDIEGHIPTYRYGTLYLDRYVNIALELLLHRYGTMDLYPPPLQNLGNVIWDRWWKEWRCITYVNKISWFRRQSDRANHSKRTSQKSLPGGLASQS